MQLSPPSFVGASKVRITALDGFDARKCAPFSFGALNPSGGGPLSTNPGQGIPVSLQAEQSAHSGLARSATVSQIPTVQHVSHCASSKPGTPPPGNSPPGPGEGWGPPVSPGTPGTPGVVIPTWRFRPRLSLVASTESRMSVGSRRSRMSTGSADRVRRERSGTGPTSSGVAGISGGSSSASNSSATPVSVRTSTTRPGCWTWGAGPGTTFNRGDSAAASTNVSTSEQNPHLERVIFQSGTAQRAPLYRAAPRANEAAVQNCWLPIWQVWRWSVSGV
eukprot:scaffold19340_cov46-Phaeocystis_antarctica.AAC.1